MERVSKIRQQTQSEKVEKVREHNRLVIEKARNANRSRLTLEEQLRREEEHHRRQEETIRKRIENLPHNKKRPASHIAKSPKVSWNANSKGK